MLATNYLPIQREIVREQSEFKFILDASQSLILIKNTPMLRLDTLY